MKKIFEVSRDGSVEVFDFDLANMLNNFLEAAHMYSVKEISDQYNALLQKQKADLIQQRKQDLDREHQVRLQQFCEENGGHETDDLEEARTKHCKYCNRIM